MTNQEDPEKLFKDWYIKVRLLQNEIDELKKVQNFSILTVAVFLLKCQVIEFELKQFIFGLDVYLHSRNLSKFINRRTRTPAEFDSDKLTLGRLKQKIDEFEGDILQNLQGNLKLLVGKRNVFTHKLFSPGKDVAGLKKEAKEGIKIADEVLDNLASIEEKLGHKNS